MADPHQETGKVDTPVMHSVTENIVVLDSNHAVTVSGLNREILHQSLSVNNLDPSSNYATVGHDTATANDDLDLMSTSSEPSNLLVGNATNEEVYSMHKQRVDEIIEPTNILMHNSQTCGIGIVTTEIVEHDLLEHGNGKEGQELNGFVSLPKDETDSISASSQSIKKAGLSHASTFIIKDAVQSVSDTNGHDQSTAIHLNEVNMNSQDSQLEEGAEDESQITLHTISQPQAIQVSASSGIPMTPEVLRSVIQQVKAQQMTLSDQQSNSSQSSKDSESGPKNNSVSFTLVSPSQQQKATAAPLGSSQNPIRIIQQGNRYTPMQQLTPDQLQQIMQVVQQQHSNKTPDNGGTVIFNPHTNTKIMYRVIYPSELHKSQASSQATYQVIKPTTLSQEQQTATPHLRRPYKKRKDVVASSGPIVNGGEEEKEKGSGDTPELSKEEKEERKKHRPRTRSGRVSKPPKHMVKDYKHIHVLDWDEDYDDSDGGYSDLKQSDEEAKGKEKDLDEQEVSSDLFQALGAGKPKNFKCQTCDKSYIGQAGLERHYRLTPEHRQSENLNHNDDSNGQNSLMADGEDSSKDASNTQDGNSSRNSDPGPDIGKFNGLDNFSEDSNTQDSINSTGTISPVVRRGRGRGVYRGRWAHLKYNAHNRRKNKLREFTKHCSDEDLMEVLFPRLVGSISTWEFLMMKAEKGGSRPQVDIIYKEFEALLRPLKKVCADYMKHICEEEFSNFDSSDKIIKVSDRNLASCLGLHVGTYKVEEMLPDDSNSFSSLHNKISAASIGLSSNATSQNKNSALERDEPFLTGKGIESRKRKFAANSPSKEEINPRKKHCLMNPVSLNIPSEHDLLTVNNSENIKSDLVLLQTTSSTLSSSSSTSSMKSTVNPSTGVLRFGHSPPQTSSPVHHLITSSSSKGNLATGRALKSQIVPVVLNSAPCTDAVSCSSSQILPVILNPKTSKGLVTSPGLAGSGNKSGHTSTLPLVLAASGSQFQGGTILLASANQLTGQSVVLKQPAKQSAQEQKQIFHPNQQHISPVSKPQISLLGSIHTPHANGTSKFTSSASALHKYNSNTKPAEVKVSRKLFHEATASSSVPSIVSSSVSSSSSSAYMNNGHLNTIPLTTSLHNVKVEYDGSSSSISSLIPPSSLSMNSAFMDSNHLQLDSGSTVANVKTELVTDNLNFSALGSSRGANGSIITSRTSPTATHVSDFNRVVTSGNDEDLDTSFDISAGVLSSIGFSGDDLSSLNTSSDNPSTIPISLPNLSINQRSSGMNEILPPSNVPSDASHIQPKTTKNGNAMSHVSHVDLSFMNGSGSEFSTISPPTLKLKDTILQTSSQSSSSLLSSSSDFIHLLSNKPSSPLMSSPCKDSGLNTVTSVSFNLASMDNSIPSQLLKSDGSTSVMMNDLGTLSFPDQSGVEQLNSGEVDSILSDQITQSEETVNPLLEMPQQLVGDDMSMAASNGEEDGQLLLTEGSNIYQTEDGTWFIQSADGNTYQLQGAQGLPMETVQALLSGNLDLSGEVPAEANNVLQ